MKTDCGNLYYNARRTAGLTQERWAELLGLSVEAVSQYERGVILPADEVVLRMAEAAGQQIVCYWHLLNKSRVAGRVLPDIKKRPLSEAVLKLLVQVEEFRRGGLEDLKRIAADGKISGADESIAYGDALEEIRLLIEAAYELQYAGTE